MRPAVASVAGYQARVTGILAINEAVLDELDRAPADWDGMVQISRSGTGEITAITADAAALNRVKARLTAAITARLQHLRSERITVPLGTLLGGQLLSGRGPRLPFVVTPSSFVQSDLVSTLEAAGINQCEYRLLLDVQVELSAVAAGSSTAIRVRTQICLADTLIVGSVPRWLGSQSGAAAAAVLAQ